MADGQEHNFGVEEILALLAQITGGGGLDNTKDLLDIQKVLYNLGMPLEDLVGIVLPEKPGDAPSYTPYVSDLQQAFPEGSSMYGAMNDIANGESAGETLAKMQELYKTQPEKFADLFMAEGYDGQPGNTPDWSWVRDTLEEFAVDNAKGVRENAAGEAELSAYQQQVDDYERSLRPTTGLSEFGDPTLEDFHGAFGGDRADALVQRLADQRREIEAAKAARAEATRPSAAARAPRLAGPPGPGFRSDAVTPGVSGGPPGPGFHPEGPYRGSGAAAIRGGYNGPPAPGFRPEGPVPDVSGGLQGAPGAPGLLQSRTPATMGFGRSQPFPQGGGGIPQGGGGIPPDVANQLLMEMAERTVGNGLPTPFGRGGISPRNIPVPAPPSDVPTVGIPQTDGGIPTPTVGIPQGAGGIPTPTVGIPQTGGGIPIPTVGIPQTDGGIPEIPGIPKGTVSVPAPVAEELVSGLAARRQGGPPGPGFRTAPQPDSGIKRNLDQLTALGQQNLQNMKMPSRQQQDNIFRT